MKYEINTNTETKIRTRSYHIDVTKTTNTHARIAFMGGPFLVHPVVSKH